MNINFKYPTYIVGGYNRDKIIDPNSSPKDIDLCMVVNSFDEMKQEILRVGGEIYLETPQYFTIRCNIPKFGPVDFTMARCDGIYSDGRRPDTVSFCDNIIQDLRRREFTVSAIAYDINKKEYIDPFGGIDDCNIKLIRCVGNAEERFTEDSLRMLRAIRFSITKGFQLHEDIRNCLYDIYFIKMLKNVSDERIYDELKKCFVYSTTETFTTLCNYRLLTNFILNNTKINLLPTLKELG